LAGGFPNRTKFLARVLLCLKSIDVFVQSTATAAISAIGAAQIGMSRGGATLPARTQNREACPEGPKALKAA
jgi:hypothetical protein